MRHRLSALLLMTLAACATETINSEDDRAFFWRGRAEVFVVSRASRAHEFRSSIELDVSGAEGDLKPNSDTIVLEDYSVVQGSLAYKPQWRFDQKLTVGAIAGVAFHELRFDSLSVNTRDRGSERFMAPLVGAFADVQPIEALSAYARFDQTAFPWQMSRRIEVGARFHVHRNFALSVGYRWWDIEIEEVALQNTVRDLDLELKGIVIGGELLF